MLPPAHRTPRQPRIRTQAFQTPPQLPPSTPSTQTAPSPGTNAVVQQEPPARAYNWLMQVTTTPPMPVPRAISLSTNSKLCHGYVFQGQRCTNQSPCPHLHVAYRSLPLVDQLSIAAWVNRTASVAFVPGQTAGGPPATPGEGNQDRSRRRRSRRGRSG